ncbi:phosphopantetheine-binding protein [Streptomyces sp. NPDC006335]|uniref:acyl carrier protein n=1 Tax=Streptomyces sp. NPDC006335 TaxID=3156895 RepID=UPI0033BDCCDB
MITRPWDEAFEALLCSAVPGLDRDQILPDTNLNAAGLDSLGAVQLLLELETTFSVSIPDDSLTLGAFATPGTIWSMVAEAMAKAGS